MYQPESYTVALAFMLLTMICWGSWANTMKLVKQFPFQLFYWDYVFGVVIGSLIWGFTLGSLMGGTSSFGADLRQADQSHIIYGLVAGAVFNVANLLLVAAIDIAGLAVAFPVGIGLALIVGSLLNYILSPRGNPWLLFGGIAVVLLAIVLDAVAYKLREREKRGITRKGIGISIASGILMGLFYPFVVKASIGPHSLGPYAVAFVFSLGLAACSLFANYLLMQKPLAGGPPIRFADYFAAPTLWHFWGVLGGAIWCSGTVLNFVASRTNIVGPAVSYAIGQGATMVSAFWGVFVWREFQGAPPKSKTALALMFLLFVSGLMAVACAPLFR